MMRNIAANALTLLIVGLVVVFGVVTWAQAQYHAKGPLSEPVAIEVERGEGLASVADKLAAAKAISSPTIFRIAARYTKLEAGLKFGEYSIPAGASMEEILELMNRGANVVRQIVVPEGLTSWQVVELLRAQGELTGDIAEVPAEGTLAPAGYDFQRADSRADILARMSARQEEILAAAWAGRAPDLPLRSPEELLTLASIVEKETGVPEERARVASVFVNRLKRGMRLQTDPSVIYGVTKGQAPLGRGLKASELGGGDALQHLCAGGAAADADRQPRQGGDRGGGASGGERFSLFRGRRLGRACLRPHPRGAQRQRGGLAADRRRSRSPRSAPPRPRRRPLPQPRPHRRRRMSRGRPARSTGRSRAYRRNRRFSR